MNGMFPGNHSEVAVGNATVFIFYSFLFLFFFFVSEGWRAVLAYLLIMCLCEYFYFESEINKISPFSNVTRCWMFFLMYPKISQNGMFFAFELIRLTKS